jgi:hypothetical protein
LRRIRVSTVNFQGIRKNQEFFTWHVIIPIDRQPLDRKIISKMNQCNIYISLFVFKVSVVTGGELKDA